MMKITKSLFGWPRRCDPNCRGLDSVINEGMAVDFDAWHVDLDNAVAIHRSGFKITVEGDLRAPTGILPGRFPEGMSAVDQATLLRCGLRALMRTAAASPKPLRRVRSMPIVESD